MITISTLWVIWSFFSLYKINKNKKNWDNTIYVTGVLLGLPVIGVIVLIAAVVYLP